MRGAEQQKVECSYGQREEGDMGSPSPRRQNGLIELFERRIFELGKKKRFDRRPSAENSCDKYQTTTTYQSSTHKTRLNYRSLSTATLGNMRPQSAISKKLLLRTTQAHRIHPATCVQYPVEYRTSLGSQVTWDFHPLN